MYPAREMPVTAPARRRNNAPVRPPRPATGVPDFLFACAAALGTMAVIFFVASLVHDDLSRGDAGTDITRIFAGTLLLSGLLLGLLGMLLLRDRAKRMDHVTVPVAIGVLAGALESWLFLDPRGAVLLLLPLLLLVFALRPVRKGLGRLFGSGPGRAR